MTALINCKYYIHAEKLTPKIQAYR